MEVEGINSVPEAYTMNGGDGPHSYTNNSSHQRRLIEAAEDLINEAIRDKLETESSSINGSKPFVVADLGCSVGQNTFIAVQNVIEAVKKEYQAKNQSTSSVEFQVFFNDHSNNDFNSLFRSLPSYRKYYAAGVAGSFYDRLFPKSSLHFVNCSYALHWMSKIPKEISDRKSPAWNENRVHYTTANAQVYEAYAAQFTNDMESFLNARGDELVGGGLMLIVIPGLPSHLIISNTAAAVNYGLIESCLSQMINLGFLSQEKVDTFNIPHYYPTSKELEELIKRNGKFSIERIGILSRRMSHKTPSVEVVVGTIRASTEGLYKEHFGDEVTEELFERYTIKLAENLDILDKNFREYEDLFVILKNKMN